MFSGAMPYDFFRVGGTLDPGAPSYVERPADRDLLRLVLSGEYCNVLTARQMGKSSLMIRTAAQLETRGVRVAIIDLSGLGTNIKPHEWYLGLLKLIRQEIQLQVDEMKWWMVQRKLSPVQRFTKFVRENIVAERGGEMAIFIDEIDSTLTVPFTDDFFAAIRSFYNERATDSEYRRLTFVLVGVARPADLIKDRKRTPYNIGRMVELRDFTLREAEVLLPGLERVNPRRSKAALQRVLHWTGGHPFLTQRLCAELVWSAQEGWSDEQIDGLATELFFSSEAIRTEKNLKHIERYVHESPRRMSSLKMYRRVLEGKRVKDEERSPEISHLKLSGLVKANPAGYLQVRNRIYERVFGIEWVQKSMPGCFERVFGLRRRRR